MEHKILKHIGQIHAHFSPLQYDTLNYFKKLLIVAEEVQVLKVCIRYHWHHSFSCTWNGIRYAIYTTMVAYIHASYLVWRMSWSLNSVRKAFRVFSLEARNFSLQMLNKPWKVMPPFPSGSNCASAMHLNTSLALFDRDESTTAALSWVHASLHTYTHGSWSWYCHECWV